MYKSLLPQCCVNKGSYYPSTCTHHCCHSAVSIRVPTTPPHVHILTATVLCQQGFLLPLNMYTSLLPQCCVNKGSYYPSTCTHPYCHSAVSIRLFTNPLHVQVITFTQCCVKKGSYYHCTCTHPYCHRAVSIRVPTTPLHVHILTATVLCQ